MKDGEPVWQPDGETDCDTEGDADSDPETHAVAECVTLGDGDAL